MKTKKEKKEEHIKAKQYLKNRVKLGDGNLKKRATASYKERAVYGASMYDAYDLDYSLGIIMANALFRYLADAESCIVRDNWNIIEKHAKAIKDFSMADSFDSCNNDTNIRWEFQKKEQDFRAAMFWLQENWHFLWW